MAVLASLQPSRVFHYFEELCAIPHGSTDQARIAHYCLDFAAAHGLEAETDAAHNVIIRKAAAVGYEQATPVILQGHLDMVCQKTPACDIDFLNDGLRLRVDGDSISADGTTLGADNGIAVAMILAVLEDPSLPHPALEAVFTTDEEIGMVGAKQLDMSRLHGKRLINLDAEEDDTLTVSCAGGSDLTMTLPLTRQAVRGTAVTITLAGLAGGHSGVEIHRGRVNANCLAGRLLHHLSSLMPFHLLAINGGEKGNAIPDRCCVQVCVAQPEEFCHQATAYLAHLQAEIADREPSFCHTVTIDGEGEHAAFSPDVQAAVIYALLCAPNGVIDYSVSIPGLVETSLNLGILKTADQAVTLHFALRSNKRSALAFLEEKLTAFAAALPCTVSTAGHYPPWEFKENSFLQRLYKQAFEHQRGYAPKVEAIHAGLECGVFAAAIDDLDCIAMGPSLFDVHTVHERLSIASTDRTYRLLLYMLENCR